MTDGSPMTPERWARVEALYWELLERAPEARSGTLERIRAQDPKLAGEVEALLREHATDPGFLDAPAVGRPAPPHDDPGLRMGRWHVVRLLGRGGMGEVFLAVDESEGVRRHVALKVVREGLASEELLRRFQRERRILASLAHPAIARLVEVGTTNDGRPYLAMEHVDGVPLTVYAEERHMGIHERIALFQEVCDAVQHAHQRLVVHRDLKPSNVLVTPEGRVKLLDFGIAKVLQGDTGDPEGEGATTVVGRQGPLTPEYASPEQIRGETLGTSSDVYSLGVVLFELLAGVHPCPGDRSDRRAVERFVLEEDPPRPSSHEPHLAGDLDNIVLKAMAREPERRYASPVALAEDLQRHLDGRPVRARAATLAYTAGRFVRRNRLLVASAASILLLLTAFSVVTALQSRRISAEAERATRERDEALAVRGFLLEMFGATGPDQAAGDSVTARQLLDRRAAVLEAEYGDRPALLAEMSGVLAEGYERLGLYGDAEPLARGAVETRLRHVGTDDPDLPGSWATLGWIQHQAGRLEEAEETLRRAVAAGRRLHPSGDPTLARALNDLGVNLEAQGDYGRAEEAYREALEMRRRVLDAGDVAMAVTASNLSVVRYRRADFAGAVEMAREAHAAFTRVLGPDHQRAMIVESNLAAMQAAMGDWTGARTTYRDILERRRRLFGTRHLSVAQTMAALAAAIPEGAGDEEAETLLREALDIQTEALGPDHPTVANTTRRLAVTVARTGRAAEAHPLFQEALRVHRATLGPDHEQVGETLALLAASLTRSGALEVALETYREALAVQRRALGRRHVTAARTEVALVRALLRADEDAEAAERLDRAWSVLAPALPPEHLFLQEARVERVRLHLRRGEAAAADSVLTQAETLLTPDQSEQLVGREMRALRRRMG